MSPTTAKSTNKPATDQVIAAESEDGRFSIKPLLKLMSEKKASDLFFTSNSPVKIKIEGKQHAVGKTDLDVVLPMRRLAELGEAIVRGLAASGAAG